MNYFIPLKTMAFYRKPHTKSNVRNIAVLSTAVLAVGDLVKTNGANANITAATSDAAFLGIALAASASGATAAIPVDILQPGEWIEGAVETGTPTALAWGKCDINTQDGVTLTNTNGDFLYQYTGKYDGTTYVVDLLPKRLEVVEDTG